MKNIKLLDTQDKKQSPKRKFKLTRKKIIAVVVAGVLSVVGTVTASRILKKDEISEIQNQIGFMDVNTSTNWFTHNVKEDNFVVLDVGDFDNYGKLFASKKMRFCNEHDISLGIIISSNATNEKDIYEDLDYAKALVRDYKIDFPVYLDINDIIENDDLNNEAKTKLINDFCTKATTNGMYVGVYGTDKNLCRMKNYCGISDYDAFLVMDKQDIEYDGYYSVVKQLDGTIKSKFHVDSAKEKDLSKIIKSKDLNNPESFVNDKVITVHFENKDFDIDELLLDLAMNYGMSVNELLNFNDMDKRDIKSGTDIRIPSYIDSIAEEVKQGSNDDYKVNIELLEDESKWKRGCDISYCQVNGNWDKVKENFDYVIIRSNNGIAKDKMFESHYKNCMEQQIPVGIYCYNNVYSKDYASIEEFENAFKEEVKTTLSLLKNKKITYPVFLDIEGQLDTVLFPGDKGAECIKRMLNIWKEAMLKEGYIPGVYFSGSNGAYVAKCYEKGQNTNISKDFIIWMAGSKTYSNRITLNEVKPSFDFCDKYIKNVHICQSTEAAVNAGIGNSNGYLDVGFSRIDITKEKTTDLEDSNEEKEKPVVKIKKSKKLWI